VTDKVADLLEVALARHLLQTTENPETPNLEIGKFCLAHSPGLGLAVADTFAELANLPRWDDFRRFFGPRDGLKPAKPSPEYIEAEARAIEPNRAKLPYAMALVADQLGKSYQDKISEYEKKRKERERIEQSFENSEAGYLRFLCAENPQALSFFFERYRTLPITEEDRKRHTYINGGAGSGKSEAIKAIFHHYLSRNMAPALVLIDPHGDVAEQVAKWPELQDGKRLVYIDPSLEPGKTPIFNPLDIPDAERNPDDIAIIVKQLIEVFPELIQGLEFTPQMRTLISACLTVLLSVRGSTLSDLMDFMDDSKNEAWLRYADEVLTGSMYRDYFRRDFMDKSSDITKRGIRMRLLEALQGNPPFLRMISGESTFNLEELLNRRAVVIFRLSRGDIGETTSNLIGKFIIARLKAFAFKQGRIPESQRIPVHAFVDECQNFLSESIEIILKEARKFGVHLTLAQQILGDGMSPDLLKAILGNTGVKITGKNATFTLKRMAEETGASLEELQTLSTGFFHIKAGNRHGVIVAMPSLRVKDKGAISKEAWLKLRSEQVARFYRLPASHNRASVPSTLAPLPIA